MATQAEPNIVGADKFQNALIIAFNDGRVASFSAALLYATLDAAQELPPETDEEDSSMQALIEHR